ncbi:translin-associated factor X-interacting protein 1-like isoform X2 [Dreissena polymorpha]|uniref:translin-associated factor X-interacting protein 1-like isoform X2 n=1 Tax=Dreissena polymorpha TaxID=45954 RepID=UPI002263BF50|nr:translin-associated factor X-interacting protein 1-like isoform X2 [Dreissena polymorpha]
MKHLVCCYFYVGNLISARNISPRNTGKFEGFNGPTYKVGGNVHVLPPPKSLRPYVDTKTGELDAWPAHASGHSVPTTSLMLTKDKSLVLVTDEQMGKPNMIPKPRFLDQLENYLKKELRALDVMTVEPNELRLQAHREVFEYLIEDFKTYKPLLSAIKNEYEMMFAYQRQQIRELEPLKQMLVTVSEQCDQKIMSIREEEKQEMTDMKQDNKRLCKRIEDLKNGQKDLETQVDKLRDELANQYKLYRDEKDARKLLQSDINDLKYQQEDIKMAQKQEAEEEEDPVMLKIALKKAREDEKAATQRLNEMIANYGDVIPRRDFEGLEKKHNELLESVEVQKNDFDKLRQEHETLLEVHKQVVKQRDEFYTECETLRRSSTPRPDWDKCSDAVRGGLARWKELSEGKTSNDLVDVLLTEMASGEIVDTGGAEYFDGQGTGPSIPKYLQHEGPVRNRRLGKRDASLLIKDIWREKGAHDASKSDGVRDKMGNFLYTYLQRRFGLEQMIVEWGYNLHDACQRYSHDEHIGLFSGVLTEEIDEEIYHHQLQLIQKLMNHLTTMDANKGNVGKLSKADFREGLASYLSGVEANTLNSMMRAAESEMDNKDLDEIEYKNLFMEDDEGRTGPFLDEIRKWDNQQRAAYVDEIKTNLKETNPVTFPQLKGAILQADIEIDSTKMDKIVLWVFKTTDMSAAQPMEQSAIIEKLLKCNVSRTGRKL